MFADGYTALYSKIKAWIASFVKPEEWEKLGSMEPGELVTAIRGRMLKAKAASDDPLAVAQGLSQEGYDYVRSAARFMAGSTREFFKYWMTGYEIENIKLIARCLLHGRPVEYLYNLRNNSKFQVELAGQLQDLDEFQNFLSGTDYYRIGQDTIPRVAEEKSTFVFEVSLDNYYAHNLQKKLGTLPGAEKKLVRQILVYSLEMNRLVWIFRARFLFGMDSENVAALLPNIFGFITDARYKTLLSCQGEQDFLELLYAYKYTAKRVADYASLEREISNRMAGLFRKFLRGTPFSLGVFLSWIQYHRFHVKNLVTVLESRKLGIPFDQVGPLLIRL